MKKQRLKAQAVMPNLAVCLKAYPDTRQIRVRFVSGHDFSRAVKANLI